MTTSDAKVVVLPDPSWIERSPTVDALSGIGVSVLAVKAPLESKSICAALLSADLQPPVVVIAHGESCLVLPAVALSLRTQHRNTLGYVLVDPDTPPASDTWPESPVHVLSATETTGTSLRGWPVVRTDADVPQRVVELVSKLLLT